MSYESHKYYNENLYASIAMYVKEPIIITRPICGYCNGCKKTSIITKPICGYYNGYKKPSIITRPICEYYNGCKKTSIYYETYMRIL
jgi:hypothetical protein